MLHVDIDTILLPSLIHISAAISPSLFFLSLLLPLVVFVWLLGFVCLLFPDGRRRLHLCGFQAPRELFTALAQALILFPLAGLYDGPFIRSNWKQLSLPVCIQEQKQKSLENLFFFYFSFSSPSEHLGDGAVCPQMRTVSHPPSPKGEFYWLPYAVLQLHHQQIPRKMCKTFFC